MAFQNNHSKEKSMNLNTGYFAAYNQRHKRATIAYRLSLNNQQQQQHLAYVKSARSSSVENKEPFLPSITTTNGNQNGHRPYRRNDFANNHLFVAKQKLAKFFLDEPIVNNQSKDDLIHLFDQQEPKQKHRRNTKSKQENYSDTKSIPSLDQDTHLSVVNLTMRPTIPIPLPRETFSNASNRRTRAVNMQTSAPRPSIEWTNPISLHAQSTIRYSFEEDLKANAIINDLIDKNSEMVNSTINPIDLSILYVKSIIPSNEASQN